MCGTQSLQKYLRHAHRENYSDTETRRKGAWESTLQGRDWPSSLGSLADSKHGTHSPTICLTEIPPRLNVQPSPASSRSTGS